MKKNQIIFVLAISVLLSGCFESGGSASNQLVSQSASCIFSAVNDAKKECKNGQVAVFMPGQWGNEQLPIYAASIFCDYRYSIVHDKGGVSCIFTDVRLKDKPQDKAESGKNKDESVK